MHDFLGKPIIYHVINNALKFNFLDKIVVSTDSSEIHDYVIKNFVNIDVIDSGKASCGTERAFKYYLVNQKFDYYLSIPSDEPHIFPDEINKVVFNEVFRSQSVSSFYSNFYNSDDLCNPLSCKIVIYNNRMIYNSRAVIPIQKSGERLELNQYNKHVGIFIFPKELFMRKGMSMWSRNSDVESLEQNRFIDVNIPVLMYKIKHIGFGIDSPEQIKILEDRVRKLNEENNRINDDD